MSLEIQDLSLGHKTYEVAGVCEKQSKVLYSREFLLSFSELEHCKKLPSGFDPSILSEFKDAFHKVQERQRAPFGSQLPGYKWSEYGSSPPTRGDSGSYSRSGFGRWDTRSSGRSDRGSDSQSDKDSDPGKNYVNPSRRSWQSSQHDGLVGNGSFARHGYGSETSLLKSAVTDDYHLKRSNGPYHPSYKAAPYSFRETKDSYNDETFGSSEGTSEDKVEQERQRRVSFELMRKEQQKVLQGKQNAGAGISEFLEDMKEEKSDLGVSNVLHESANAAIPVNDSITSSILSQSTTSRPPVPPGFANAIGEKNYGVKPSVHTCNIEKTDGQPDDKWTTSSAQSSKISDRFLEEERNPAEDPTHGRPNDLLSLIVGGDKGICQSSDEKYMGHLLSENSQKGSEFASELLSGLSSKSNDISNHQSDSKTEVPSVLTCEDLEQTILSELSVKNLNVPLTEQPMQCSILGDAKPEQLRPVDNNASQRLLSLLHKDTGLTKMQLRPDMEIRLHDVSTSNEWDMKAALGETSKDGLKGGPGSSTHTLEALFGSAFMRELQSEEAPVSVQRGSVEPAQTNVLEDLGIPLPLMSGGSTHIVANKVGQKSASQRGDNLPLNRGQESRSESWLGVSDSPNEPDSLKHLIGLNSRHSDILEVDRCQLSEEEMLITNNDPLRHPNLIIRPTAPSLQGQLSLNAPINIVDKFTATVPESSPFVQDPYNRTEPEIPHHNLYAQPSSSHPFRNLVTTQEKPSPLNSHPARMHPHTKFIGTESMIHRPSVNHQLPADMVRPPFHQHPGARVTGVNIASHNPISQQTQISMNHPQQQFPRFQRTVLPHPGNQPNGLMQELNSMQGFPFGPYHPHMMSSSGLPIPALNIYNGSNHPEAFQRLLEMERRAKSNQMHPPPPGHSQTMYDNELEPGFRYK